jgi:hypothetical protein
MNHLGEQHQQNSYWRHQYPAKQNTLTISIFFLDFDMGNDY